jgi:hypothetical protein
MSIINSDPFNSQCRTLLCGSKHHAAVFGDPSARQHYKPKRLALHYLQSRFKHKPHTTRLPLTNRACSTMGAVRGLVPRLRYTLKRWLHGFWSKSGKIDHIKSVGDDLSNMRCWSGVSTLRTVLAVLTAMDDRCSSQVVSFG